MDYMVEDATPNVLAFGKCQSSKSKIHYCASGCVFQDPAV
jgi:hypothetical protein